MNIIFETEQSMLSLHQRSCVECKGEGCIECGYTGMASSQRAYVVDLVLTHKQVLDLLAFMQGTISKSEESASILSAVSKRQLLHSYLLDRKLGLRVERTARGVVSCTSVVDENGVVLRTCSGGIDALRVFVESGRVF